ncbi:MAG: alkaline phosphatase [Dictyoglomaceae bacterium]|nr:alkaline phosphatase [Dictyoglomaceae bacterium]
MKIRKILMNILLISLLIFSLILYSPNIIANPESVSLYRGAPVKYIFLFIGDGMGFNHVHLTEIFLGAMSGKKDPSIQKLSFTQFPEAGYMSTYAADTYITDSASAITAMLAGKKTSDGVINMDPDKKIKYKSVFEMAKELGRKVGVITSVSIDHATPAGCYAHQPSRSNYYEIALELANSNFDFFGGGGFLQPKGRDGRSKDIIEILKEKGYKVVDKAEEIMALKPGVGKVVAINPVLDSSKAMPYAINRLRGINVGLSLADFVKKGIELLDNPNGFIMMVEGGKIDWASHANDAGSVIHDILDFDKAVKVALEFYRKRPSDTLIIVTADHETGGLSLGYAGTRYELYTQLLSKQKISFDEFSKIVAEYREKTQGKGKLEDLLTVVKEFYGLEVLDESSKKILEEKSKQGDIDSKIRLMLSLTKEELEELNKAFNLSMLAPKDRPSDVRTYLLYGGYEPFVMMVTRILNQKAGVSWTSYAHTSALVPIYAIGRGAYIFKNYFDNTDLYKKLCSLLGLDPYKDNVISQEYSLKVLVSTK